MARAVLEGRSGSPGSGVGRALWVEVSAGHEGGRPRSVNGTGPAEEESRLRAALDAAAAELAELARATSVRAGDDVGAIFEAQAIFARDPGLIDPALERVRAGIPAAGAIEQVAAEQADVLAGLDDPYLRERAADLRDVARRVVDRLLGVERRPLHHADGTPAVLAAADIEPSLVAAIRPELVQGIALAGGTANGHAAIVARALGIPLVLGLGDALDARVADRPAMVDGGEGRVILDPTDEDLEAIRFVVESSPATKSDARTGDVGVDVEANVGSLLESVLAAEVGADGIGLVRTELLFLGRAVAPGLAEQRTVYRRLAAPMGQRRVVFRTLDIGGDKPAGFLPTTHEENPALGVRGVRLGLRDPALLETQLRALLEATPERALDILLPMVSTVDEIFLARAALDRAAAAADEAGTPRSREVHVGIMIEVPAAALMADVLVQEVDFVSIGTNDLVQYSLAADRTNADLAELASPFQPAVLRLVDRVVRAGRGAGVPVGVCGEAAADPLVAPLLVGLGVGALSVAPRSVGRVRERLSRVDVAACRAAAVATLAARNVAEVREIAERVGAGSTTAPTVA